MAVAVVELDNDFEFARHAEVQLEELGVKSEKFVVDQLVDLPGEVANRLESFEAVIALADMTGSDYVSETVSELMRVDSNTDKNISKVLKEKGVQDRHTYHRDLQNLASERAEKLARKIN